MTKADEKCTLFWVIVCYIFVLISAKLVEGVKRRKISRLDSKLFYRNLH